MPQTLEQGTYEIIRNRLLAQGNELQQRLAQLNEARKQVFGSIELKLLNTERVTTEHNCVPADMVPVGRLFLFGYNVHLGLKTETSLSDVFSVYRYADHVFHQEGLELLQDERFQDDFRNLYRYYRNTQFRKFALIGPHLFMVCQVGKSVSDVKTFKWVVQGEQLVYVDNRSDHEFVFPDQHEFRWKKAGREQQRTGKFPHISIEDRVFIETIGGDLTIKVEDNTDSGHGIYSEPVELKDQTLDDAEIFYAVIGNIIVLKVRPYKEPKYRYIVFNQKVKQALRIDSLEDACVLLPDDQGIIFSNGYYLQTGEYKLFDNLPQRMKFEKLTASPNGEDFLYVFYNPADASYLLHFYNLIQQRVELPIHCHGFSIFENGEMCFFRTEDTPQRHHAIQVWQTPFTGPNYKLGKSHDSFLYKLGNKDIVRAMAECHELALLLRKDDTYLNLYLDLVQKSVEISDSYYWLGHEETFNLKEPLTEIHNTANTAIGEFEKVARIRKNTAEQIEAATANVTQLVQQLRRSTPDSIRYFVDFLARFRALRGEVISLKDLRYADLELIERHEQQLGEHMQQLSLGSIGFLLKPDSLAPYSARVEGLKEAVQALEKVADANRLEKEIEEIAKELEMLIEVVSSLKIEDATQTTEIIDRISGIYASFNQIKAALRNKRKELAGTEGKAEFNAQLKLIDQAVVNYLDVCDRPDKCEEYLNKLMVQLEELESRFSEFDDFIGTLTEKREEVYNVFESKKLQLVESLHKRTGALLQSAERILKGIQSKALGMNTVAEVNGYFASDLMVDKTRDIIRQLQDLGDTTKADDVQSRLKTVREEAIRQLKDRSELFAAGADIISFGSHQFLVNRQPLDLTTVLREGELYYHLTGTGFFEKITDADLQTTRPVWEQQLVSENNQVYRSEFLAYKLLESARAAGGNVTVPQQVPVLPVEELHKLTQAELQAYVQRFMAPRYQEGYVKGVHDFDASLLLHHLVQLYQSTDLLRYSSEARACAHLWWANFAMPEQKELLNNRLKGVGVILQVFPNTRQFVGLIEEVQQQVNDFISVTRLFDAAVAAEAGEYLFYEQSRGDVFVIDEEAAHLHQDFMRHLHQQHAHKSFAQSVKSLEQNPAACFKLVLKWVLAYLDHHRHTDKLEYADEVAVLLLTHSYKPEQVLHVPLKRELEGLAGSHTVVENGRYHLHYNAYLAKMRHHEAHTVPQYERFVQLKKDLLERTRHELRLHEFMPQVLSSFVRNRLIDQVYLPLIGSNLAKQIGTAGDNKRTDRMGMLLLISPPGYGKTTLMEYIASRLGIIFMKINGPALGHKVTSVDPSESTNAAAHEELHKLNLAFEMGDNVMIYLDDIQHCHPEFLQKFISLCDGQRKIEGTWKGRSRTYDFRGKKVAVVMAGNPYTESGEKFRIPDMLSNRADTYNLGDIIGETEDVFKLSYLENCLTANPVLRKLSAKSHKDLYPLLQLTETGTHEGLEFEAQHAPEELNDYVAVLQRLLRVRDVILKVNQEYISSAAQAEEFRTEPAFKLQGSYRDMNKLAEKVLPVLNDQELHTLIATHYQNEAQTLTTGAEANLLKLRELLGWLTPVEADRWEEIKAVFRKNKKYHGMDAGNQVTHVVVQMEAISEGLAGIKEALEVKKVGEVGLN